MGVERAGRGMGNVRRVETHRVTLARPYWRLLSQERWVFLYVVSTSTLKVVEIDSMYSRVSRRGAEHNSILLELCDSQQRGNRGHTRRSSPLCRRCQRVAGEKTEANIRVADLEVNKYEKKFSR